MSSLDLEKVLVLWANTSLGMLLRWWHSNKQQSGRGNIGKTALQSMSTLDASALKPQQLEKATRPFDEMSNGYILNLSWWPEQNIDLAVQYTGFLRFNGGDTNYDGAGRSAGGNNAIFLLARFVF